MKKLLIAAAALACLSTSACVKDTDAAVNEANWADKPASITCWTYGVVTFNGASTGKITFEEGGRVTFVDAANQRLTVIEGDCRIIYAP